MRTKVEVNPIRELESRALEGKIAGVQGLINLVTSGGGELPSALAGRLHNLDSHLVIPTNSRRG